MGGVALTWSLQSFLKIPSGLQDAGLGRGADKNHCPPWAAGSWRGNGGEGTVVEGP